MSTDVHREIGISGKDSYTRIANLGLLRVRLHCGIESKLQSGISLKTKYGRRVFRRDFQLYLFSFEPRFCLEMNFLYIQ